MDIERAALVVFLTLLVVGLFNLSLFMAFRRDRSSGGMVEMFKRASQRAKDPWKDEDDALGELRRRVDELTSQESEDEE